MNSMIYGTLIDGTTRMYSSSSVVLASGYGEAEGSGLIFSMCIRSSVCQWSIGGRGQPMYVKRILGVSEPCYDRRCLVLLIDALSLLKLSNDE